MVGSTQVGLPVRLSTEQLAAGSHVPPAGTKLEPTLTMNQRLDIESWTFSDGPLTGVTTAFQVTSVPSIAGHR